MVQVTKSIDEERDMPLWLKEYACGVEKGGHSERRSEWIPPGCLVKMYEESRPIVFHSAGHTQRTDTEWPRS